MRILVLVPAIVLASSALHPAFAIDGKTDVKTHLQQQEEQKGTNNVSDKSGIDQSSAGKMQPDDQTVGRAGDSAPKSDGSKIDPDWKAHPDRN